MYLTVFSSILDGSKKLCKVFAKFLQSFCKVFKNFANYHKPIQRIDGGAPDHSQVNVADDAVRNVENSELQKIKFR